MGASREHRSRALFVLLMMGDIKHVSVLMLIIQVKEGA